MLLDTASVCRSWTASECQLDAESGECDGEYGADDGVGFEGGEPEGDWDACDVVELVWVFGA